MGCGLGVPGRLEGGADAGSLRAHPQKARCHWEVHKTDCLEQEVTVTWWSRARSWTFSEPCPGAWSLGQVKARGSLRRLLGKENNKIRFTF